MSKATIKKKAAAFFKEFTSNFIIAMLVEIAKPLIIEFTALIVDWIKAIF